MKRLMNDDKMIQRKFTPEIEDLIYFSRISVKLIKSTINTKFTQISSCLLIFKNILKYLCAIEVSIMVEIRNFRPENGDAITIPPH